MEVTVGVDRFSASVVKAKMMRRPPVARKRTCERIYVRRILSVIMAKRNY